MCTKKIFFLLLVYLESVFCESSFKSCELAPRGSAIFPSNFSFGAATSAFQVEGSWNVDGKGISIWDDFTHNHPEKIVDHSNGDVAAESYTRFDQDLEALKQLKVKYYRFSIAWTRIFPTGDISSKNQKGIDYYNSLIDKLIENGIEPMVTIYHADLPLDIQKLGGFTNSLIIELFSVYSIELFKLFGDRVKTWLTFNEPFIFCNLGYGQAIIPPGIEDRGIADYICIDNVLKAHAVVYRAYRSKFYKEQCGRVGIALFGLSFYNKSNDTSVIHRGMEFFLGMVANPIYGKQGGYPKVVEEDIKRNSLKEGRLRSRLPGFPKIWRDQIKGSADFLGLNYYTSFLLNRGKKPSAQNPSFARDIDCHLDVDPNWFTSKLDYFSCVPKGLEDILKFVREQYNNPEVIITESGWPGDEVLEDNDRIQFFKTHLQAVLNAIHDGSKITGYTAWSLIDNFDGINGYSVQFGLYAVNMTSPQKERVPRKSAFFFRELIETYKIPKTNSSRHL